MSFSTYIDVTFYLAENYQMSIPLKDVPDYMPIPDEMMTYAIVAFFPITIGLFAGCLVSYAIIKQRQIPVDSKFTLSLVIADLILSAAEFMFCIYGFSDRRFHGRLCLPDAIVLIFSFGVSIYSKNARSSPPESNPSLCQR